MKKDFNTLESILKNTKMEEKCLSLSSPGTITAEAITIEVPEEALRKFLAFGGEGWLCLGSQRDIMRLPSTFTPGIDDWPEQGELCHGESSMHLSMDGTGKWNLVTFCRNTDEDKGLIVRHELLARDAADRLVYEVYWGLEEHKEGQQSCDSFEEYRPVLYRFAGFAGEGK